MRQLASKLSCISACLLAIGLLVLLAGCRKEVPVQPAGTMFPNGTQSTTLKETAASRQAAKEAAASTATTPDTPKTAAAPATPTVPEKPAEPANSTSPIVTNRAIITTVKGTMEVDLYGKDAPKTVANFVKLAKKKFYNGLTFHRVETGAGFQLIQGGDPDGNGSGGSDQTIKLEISPKLRHWEGALAMARASDPDSASSQFYICNCDIAQLDGSYAVFGKVVKGLDVSKRIKVGDKISSIVIR